MVEVSISGGADEKGQKLKKICEHHQIDICGFMDNGLKENGTSVYTSNEILSQGPENTFVVVSMLLRHKRAVLTELNDNGYTIEDYFYPCMNLDAYGFEWKYGTVDAYEVMFERGRNIAESLDPYQMYYLAYGGHIGDIVLGLSYLHSFKETKRIKNITVITSEKSKGLACYYKDEINDILTMQKDDLEALRIYAEDKRRTQLNIFGATWNFVPIERRVPFPVVQTMYKCMHLGLEYQAKSQYIADDKSMEGFDTYIQSTTIEKGKSLILVPYTQSAKAFPLSFWEKIAKTLSRKYRVFTNIGPGEKAIQGTEGVYIPLAYVVDTFRYAGYSVSIRCGLADLLALGNCNTCVLYNVTNDEERNYANVNSRYINGDESILSRKAVFVESYENLDDVTKLIKEKIENGDAN